MIRTQKSRTAGFTLIELLVVISIISLLSSVVLSALNDARAKGRDTARIRALNETRTALNMYFNDKGQYPYNESCGNDPYDLSKSTCQKWIELLTKGGYIKEIPKEIRYRADKNINAASGTCANTTDVCLGYNMAVKLEKLNPVLKSDKDQTTGASTAQPWWIDGISATDYCNYDEMTDTSKDLCYDVSSY